MTNLRIISDNAVDRVLSITASTTAGTLAATNLMTDVKSAVWRSTGTAAQLTLTWSTAELVTCVVLPYCNLTQQATIRVRGYANAADANPVADTGAMLACPAPAAPTKAWQGLLAGANAYAYGGGACGRIWFNQVSVCKLVIDLVDVANPFGYLEAARLIAGAYWSPVKNMDYGSAMTPVDLSKNYRNSAGDLRTDAGTRNTKVAINLNMMTPDDRAELVNIMRRNGLSSAMFVSLYPGAADLRLERDHQVYGKLVAVSSTTLRSFRTSSAPIEIESI